MRPNSERGMPGPHSTNSVGVPVTQSSRSYSDWVKRVRPFPLFADIALNDRAQIIAAARERQLSRGQTIYIEGDSLRHFVMLTSGSAKMIQHGQDGSAVILRLCGPGDLVGTPGLWAEQRCRSTSQALTPCSSLVWDRGVFESLARRFPVLKLNLAQMVSKQLVDMEDRFREISTEPAATRLSRQILRLVECVGIPSNGSVEISITREELGQLIGTTLFTVSRLLSELDRQEIVTTRREGFSVYNLKALADMVASCDQN